MDMDNEAKLEAPALWSRLNSRQSLFQSDLKFASHSSFGRDHSLFGNMTSQCSFCFSVLALVVQEATRY